MTSEEQTRIIDRMTPEQLAILVDLDGEEATGFVAAIGRRQAGGSTTPSYSPPSVGSTSDERRMQQLAQKFNDSPRDAYGARYGISTAEVDEYTRLRAIEHFSNQINFWSEMTRSDAAARRRISPWRQQ